jgi:iron(III) transport system substrate-binding protein
MQEVLGKSDIDFEYPLAAGVAAHPSLKPLDQLQPPAVSVSQLGDDRESAQMLRTAGLL